MLYQQIKKSLFYTFWFTSILSLLVFVCPKHLTIHSYFASKLVLPTSNSFIHNPSLIVNPNSISSATKASALDTYNKRPLAFEANQGQIDKQFKFLSRGNGYNLFLSSNEVVMALKAKPEDKEAIMRMQLVGANTKCKISGLAELPSKTNYFKGRDSNQWQTNITNYSKVLYKQVYPGIDMIYYGNQEQLEYDFIVFPGADLKSINIKFEGAEKIYTDTENNLVVKVDSREIYHQKPVTYQEKSGKKCFISSSYSISESGIVSFQIGNYDKNIPLVIDPVLTYSTYLGGSDSDISNDITVDSNGNAYVVGTTQSSDFPLSSAFQQAFNGGSSEIFITKLDLIGKTLNFSTYFGGKGTEGASNVVVDLLGNIYITGVTNSVDFPIMNAIQPKNGGEAEVRSLTNAFVVKLASNGNSLIYSTYLGGGGDDVGSNIAVDTIGNAYIIGTTSSTNFPLVTPIQTITSPDGNFLKNTVFVSKISASGIALMYSTYLGSRTRDEGKGIAVDTDGNAYIIGVGGKDFPTTPGIFQTVSAPGVFIAKINPLGNKLDFSMYLPGVTVGKRIAIDSNASVYILGETTSTLLPVTPNALQTVCKSCPREPDLFLIKIDHQGTKLEYSSYIGGNAWDIAGGIAIDSTNNVYISGATNSPDFPVVDAINSICKCNGSQTPLDAFVLKLNSAGNQLVYSTFLGGTSNDEATGVAVDTFGNAFVTGGTDSFDFPTSSNPFQPSLKRFTDVFVAKISRTQPEGFLVSVNPESQSIVSGSSTSFSVKIDALRGFNSLVNLKTDISPSTDTITSSFSLTTIKPSEVSNLTINTTPNTPIQPYSITITGTSGQITSSKTVNLDVKNAATPDFSLSLNPSKITVKQGQNGFITITINRIAGFSGNLVITAPDAKPFKINFSPPNQSTTGTSISFNFKVKKKAPIGSREFAFTAKDDSGRVRTATLNLIIQ